MPQNWAIKGAVGSGSCLRNGETSAQSHATHGTVHTGANTDTHFPALSAQDCLPHPSLKEEHLISRTSVTSKPDLQGSLGNESFTFPNLCPLGAGPLSHHIAIVTIPDSERSLPTYGLEKKL